MTSEEFIHATAYLSCLWPGFDPAEGTFDVWEHHLADIPAQYVIAAIDDLSISGREFVPPVGLIRKRAIELGSPGIPDVDEAWAEVTTAIQRIGHRSFPLFSHEAVESTVRAMGWRALCLSENQAADRAHFFRLYDTCRSRQQRQAIMAPTVRALLDSAPLQLERV